MKLASLEAIISVLNNHNVKYIVVGGLAVTAHGYGRVTFDVDLVLQLESHNVHEATKALESLEYKPLVPVKIDDFSDPDKRKNWIEEKGMIVFQLYSDQHPETRIDLFVQEPFDFDEEYQNALIEELLPGYPVRFVRLETLINMKAVADREKDREDIKQLKILNENPDNE